MNRIIKIGTRESKLALWQATEVKKQLELLGYQAALELIKSEGDIDLITPLYELGVQGIFTKTLDHALLQQRIDIAVHSMKDVPTVMARGIVQAAVLPRASFADLMVPYADTAFMDDFNSVATIATGSVRRKAQWLNRYPNHTVENLRGNVNTRLAKLSAGEWSGAIFAAAGLERIEERPDNALELEWMLPAPAQGAILVVALADNHFALEAAQHLHHQATAVCVQSERDFLRALLGGCSTPISAHAVINGDAMLFRGNILSLDGKQKVEITKTAPVAHCSDLGTQAAMELLENGGRAIAEQIRNAGGTN
jgi:hydroxymethylbilane synthase